MNLLINLRHLEHEPRLLEGEISPDDLGLEEADELIRLGSPLAFSLEASLQPDSFFLQGRWSILLDCECARCLKRFPFRLEAAEWSRLVPLEGEDSLPQVGDQVDLTPLLREDILLGFPQRPLCKPECPGLKELASAKGGCGAPEKGSAGVEAAWSALNHWKSND
jgi:uncharacterized protein